MYWQYMFLQNCNPMCRNFKNQKIQWQNIWYALIHIMCTYLKSNTNQKKKEERENFEVIIQGVPKKLKHGLVLNL